MLEERAGEDVTIGEDALSTLDSHTDSTAATASGTTSTVATTTSNASSSSSSTQENRGGFFSFLKRLFGFLKSWFGLGAAAEEQKKRDSETVSKVIECFRNDNVEGMKEFLEDDVVPANVEEEELWWDEKDVAAPPKPTPHFNKVIPAHVRKAVRFNKDYTPEEKPNRAFAPLFTSTPKNAVDENDDSDDEDIVPLGNCDSNTVLAPRTFNNTSSIMLANTSVIESWNKCRQQTDNALRQSADTSTARKYYTLYYDDTDEEEVLEEEEEAPGIAPTPLGTFVVNKEPMSPSVHEQSVDMEYNTSTDSSVVLVLDRLGDYIQSLEDEIIAANRFGRERDVARGHGAFRHAQVLQERLAQMNEAINKICGKFERHEGSSSGDYAADDDKKDISNAFEDSCWAGRLDFDDASLSGPQ